MKDDRENKMNFIWILSIQNTFTCNCETIYLSQLNSLNTHCFTSKIYFYLVLNKTHVVFITLINLTASSYLHFLILHEFSSRLRTNLLRRHLSFRDLFHKVFVRLLFSVAPQSGEQYIDNFHEDSVDIHFWMEFLGDGRHLGD